MATRPFVVQHTANAYGPNEAVPDSAWRDLSRHATYGAARRALRRAVLEMRGRCGPNAWDSNHRVQTLSTLPLEQTCHCFGPIGGPVSPDCRRSATTSIIWFAGQPEPSLPPPDGWDNHAMCGPCRAAELAAHPSY